MEARLARLEAESDLRRLKAEYAAAADAKYLPNHSPAPPETYLAAAHRQAECFTEDAIWDAGSLSGELHGRPAILAFFQAAPWHFATHLYTAPLLAIRGDTATGEWRLWELAIRAGGGPVLLTGRTQESYRREAGIWRISRMEFLELHELTLPPETNWTCLLPPEMMS